MSIPSKRSGQSSWKPPSWARRASSTDRRFMLFKITDSGELKSMQISHYPQCGLFSQELDTDAGIIRVRYRTPVTPLLPKHEAHDEPLEVPLRPETAGLEVLDVNLHNSPADVAYGMGDPYDTWFSACFGFAVRFVYIGDGKRLVLGNLAPQASVQQPKGWASTLASYVPGSVKADETPTWITFTDVAPFLVTCESSLQGVRNYMEKDGDKVEMYKFRPNIVVDGEDEWSEDFWAELLIKGERRLVLTANCGRCSSLNVDYETGKPASGEIGNVLKRLMKERKVDKGYKYSPVFGRYGFLADGELKVSIGDEVEVSKRNSERTSFAWPGLA
ncbi:MOSC domain-containing protein [Mycena olivaceomarginata]|nr:MOSC domain-containing protein [Mycena olivaceomarginata]